MLECANLRISLNTNLAQAQAIRAVRNISEGREVRIRLNKNLAMEANTLTFHYC